MPIQVLGEADPRTEGEGHRVDGYHGARVRLQGPDAGEPEEGMGSRPCPGYAAVESYTVPLLASGTTAAIHQCRVKVNADEPSLFGRA